MRDECLQNHGIYSFIFYVYYNTHPRAHTSIMIDILSLPINMLILLKYTIFPIN